MRNCIFVIRKRRQIITTINKLCVMFKLMNNIKTMYKIITILIFIFCSSQTFSQVGLWTWVNGDTTMNSNPHYGIQGIPDSLNHPAGFYEGSEWTDKNGNFWFFEGQSVYGYRNDLWKYTPSTNEWTWMKGSGVLNDTGSYGIQGVPSITNLPCGKGYGTATWTDTTGNLWMYGGGAYNASGNELWKYDISTNIWTWIKGSKHYTPAVYGIRGVPSQYNTPGDRDELVCSWTDNNNNLWLFGGDANADARGDLWRYEIEKGEWTWMKGSTTPNAQGVYGIRGVEDSLNEPGARWCYSHWKDNNGNFWLFGGQCHNNTNKLNDLWKYNVSTNNWVWIKGPNNGYHDPGVEGNVCQEDTSFNPYSRTESRSCWKDNNGNFWLFGGGALKYSNGNTTSMMLNDIWMYNVASNEWSKIWADSTYYLVPNFGTKGVAAPCNKPSDRMGAVSWYDHNTNSMYLFGGYQYYPGILNYRSDLWKYEIESSCSVHECIDLGISEKLNDVNLSVFPNPSTTFIIISIEFFRSQNIELNIYNLFGEKIYHSIDENTGEKFSKEVNIQQYENGIYYLQLQTKDKVITKKIVKQ